MTFIKNQPLLGGRRALTVAEVADEGSAGFGTNMKLSKPWWKKIYISQSLKLSFRVVKHFLPLILILKIYETFLNLLSYLSTPIPPSSSAIPLVQI